MACQLPGVPVEIERRGGQISRPDSGHGSSPWTSEGWALCLFRYREVGDEFQRDRPRLQRPALGNGLDEIAPFKVTPCSLLCNNQSNGYSGRKPLHPHVLSMRPPLPVMFPPLPLLNDVAVPGLCQGVDLWLMLFELGVPGWSCSD